MGPLITGAQFKTEIIYLQKYAFNIILNTKIALIKNKIISINWFLQLIEIILL